MKYDTTTYKKHKRPKGWGSLCPTHMDKAKAQSLLDSSAPAGDARFNVDGDLCFRAFPHSTSPTGVTLWHGHPIPWSRLPSAAKHKLIETGRVCRTTYNKALRKRMGAEFTK